MKYLHVLFSSLSLVILVVVFSNLGTLAGRSLFSFDTAYQFEVNADELQSVLEQLEKGDQKQALEAIDLSIRARKNIIDSQPSFFFEPNLNLKIRENFQIRMID